MTDIRLERISGSDQAACDAVLELLRDGFFPDEACCRGCDLTASDAAVQQLCHLVRLSLQDGVSVGLYCGDKMVAVCVNKIQVPPAEGETSFFELFRDEHATDPRARFLMDFMLRIDAKADLFGALGAGRERRILELMFLGVLPSHRGRGFGRMVAQEALALAKQIGASGVSAIFTSKYSQGVGRQLGFKVLAEVNHSEFVFEGVPMNERVGPEQQVSYLVLLEL